MKLSEAIILGSATCEMVAADMSCCALGAALNAVGDKEIGTNRYASVRRFWPWTSSDGTIQGEITNLASSIYQKFDRFVCNGFMTLEQLADYVKTIEPDCGTCNRFECTCVAPATEPVTESQYSFC